MTVLQPLLHTIIQFRKLYVCVVQGRSGLAGSQTGRSFPRRSFARPSWLDEDTVDSADTSESLFFSKVSTVTVIFPIKF